MSADSVDPAEALRAAVLTDSPASRAILAAALRDVDESIRLTAAEIYSELRPEGAAEHLREAIKVEPDSLTLAFLLSALGFTGDAEDMLLLRRYTTHTDASVRVHAHLGVGVLGLELSLSGLSDELAPVSEQSLASLRAASEISEIAARWKQSMFSIAATQFEAAKGAGVDGIVSDGLKLLRDE